MISPREAWLEQRVGFLENKLKYLEAARSNHPSYYYDEGRPLTIESKTFPLTEMVRVQAFIGNDKAPRLHMRTCIDRAGQSGDDRVVGYQYMVSEDLLWNMGDAERLAVLQDLHVKALDAYSRKIWGSPFEGGSQGND